MRNQPIPSWEEIAEELRKETEPSFVDGRAMHSQNKEWVVKKYHELQENNPDRSQSDIFAEVQVEYEAEFGDELRKKHGTGADVEISTSTIRRYLGVK